MCARVSRVPCFLTILLVIAMLVFVAARVRAADPDVFPGATWGTKKPDEVRLDASKLDAFRDYVGGRGCVVRNGYMVYTWGDHTQRGDVASACKPWYSHFLFKAVEDGKLPSLDQPVVQWEPRLNGVNPNLDHKDRRITWRHMANQVSC